MSRRGASTISRRTALAGGGALVVHFALGSPPARPAGASRSGAAGYGGPPRVRRGGSDLPGSLRRAPMLDSWLRIDSRGAVTLFTGKAELGQGIETALVQIAAEELAIEPARIAIVTADTDRTPDEGYTAGSHSMQDSGTAILNVAAQTREILVRLASQQLRIPPEQLRADGGTIAAPDGRRIAYGALVSAQTLHVRAEPQSHLTEPARHRLIGTSMPRLDIPLKLTGEPIYVQDLRLPGMVHARVVRPPSYGAQLLSVDLEAARRLPGVIEVVRDGSYLAVVASREHQAIVAMEALTRAARWREHAELPDEARLFEGLAGWPSHTLDIAGSGASDPAAQSAPAGHILQAEYRRPYLMHASIGPSCAVARFDGGRATVWTHTQGVFPLRRALAELLQLPEDRVHCIQTQGSGCYGHNGADDAAADAALIAKAVPGRAVRVQWMRADEHLWEPYGPAMLARVRGALDAQGRIASWDYEVWSNTHSMRPGGAGDLMPAWFLAHSEAPSPPRPIPLPEGGGDRNALPFYRIPRVNAQYHFIPQMPLRVSALRSLGAHLNVFAIESFMEELARAAGADSIEFRLRHLEDPRAISVIQTAAERFGWPRGAPPRDAGRHGLGRGFAFARYKNLAAYAAVAVEVRVDRNGRIRVRRAVAAVDCGEAVNPDGVRNQIEGGILQATSWTVKESVMFDRRRIRSRDWASYPILRFEDVPDSIDVMVADRPGEPFLGVGEAAQGPTAAAIANAVADAAGVRVRELPLGRSASQIRAGIVLRAS